MAVFGITQDKGEGGVKSQNFHSLLEGIKKEQGLAQKVENTEEDPAKKDEEKSSVKKEEENFDKDEFQHYEVDFKGLPVYVDGKPDLDHLIATAVTAFKNAEFPTKEEKHKALTDLCVKFGVSLPVVSSLMKAPDVSQAISDLASFKNNPSSESDISVTESFSQNAEPFDGKSIRFAGDNNDKEDRSNDGGDEDDEDLDDDDETVPSVE